MLVDTKHQQLDVTRRSQRHRVHVVGNLVRVARKRHHKVFFAHHANLRDFSQDRVRITDVIN
jgi:hypothetical protein